MDVVFRTKKRISASVKIACQLKQPNNSKPLARFHLLFRQVCRGQTCRMGERRSTFVLIGLVGKKKRKYLWIWKFLDGDWNALNTSKTYHTSSVVEIGLLFVVESLSRDRLFATPWTVVQQTPLCIGLRIPFLLLVIGTYSAEIQEKNPITMCILYTRCILYSRVSAKASFILSESNCSPGNLTWKLCADSLFWNVLVTDFAAALFHLCSLLSQTRRRPLPSSVISGASCFPGSLWESFSPVSPEPGPFG